MPVESHLIVRVAFFFLDQAPHLYKLVSALSLSLSQDEQSSQLLKDLNVIIPRASSFLGGLSLTQQAFSPLLFLAFSLLDDLEHDQKEDHIRRRSSSERERDRGW